MSELERFREVFSRSYIMGILGAAAFFGSGAGVYEAWDADCGGNIHFTPIGYKAEPLKSTVNIDYLNISDNPSASWLISKSKPDAFLSGEVDPAVAEKIHNTVPSYDGRYVVGDRINHFQEGGFGDVMYTKQIPDSFRSRKIPGVTDLISASIAFGQVIMDKAITARQDNRDIESENIKVLYNGAPEELQIFNTHVSGDTSVHIGELNDIVHFIQDNEDPTLPAVLCADFNDSNSDGSLSNTHGKAGFVLLPKHGTSYLANFNGDWCAINIAGQSITANVTVVDRIGNRSITSKLTDHRLLKMTVHFQDPTDISSLIISPRH